MRHPLSAVVAAVLVLGISGCSDDPEPKFADPTTDPPSSTATTEPITDPPTSTPTDEPRPESAQAFIRRWHKVGDAMQLSGKTDEYLALGPECQSCMATAQLVASYYEAGGFIDFSGTTVRSIKKTGVIDGTFEFEVGRSAPATRYRTSSTARTMSLPGGETTLRMKLRRAGASWLLVDYSQIAS